MGNLPIGVLVVFANPRGTSPLRLGAEDRAIHESIKLSRYRDNILLKTCHASTIHDLRRALLEEEFQIVHISGHGTDTGLVLEDESGGQYLVPQQALADLLQAYSPPLKCVILNACFSLSQGQLTSLGVPFTIAMEGSIDDSAAIEFSRGFYDAIGAGRDIEFAYQEGCRTVKLAAPNAQFVSKILKKDVIPELAGTPKTRALEEYLSSVVSEMALWRGLGLGRDVSIDDIYVSHTLKDGSQSDVTSKEIIIESKLLQWLLDGVYPGALIVGRAGSGKSTLLKRWSLALAQIARQSGTPEWIPLYLPLGLVSYLYDRQANWRASLAELVADQFPYPSGKTSESLSEALTAVISAGKAVILLDAADEVPEEARPDIKRWLERTLRSARKCPIVITARPCTFYISEIAKGKEFEIRDFGTEQIELFINKWFSFSNDQSAVAMIERLNCIPRLKIMAGNPLFLTMMCIDFEINQDVSSTPGALFEQFVRILLQHWDREKGVKRTLSQAKSIPLSLELTVLGAVASHFFELGQTNFTEGELISCVQKTVSQLGSPYQATDIIEEIERASGILVVGRQGYCRFCHSLFQDFFVARDVFEKVIKGEIDETKWFGENWQEDKFKNIVAFFHELRRR